MSLFYFRIFEGWKVMITLSGRVRIQKAVAAKTIFSQSPRDRVK